MINRRWWLFGLLVIEVILAGFYSASGHLLPAAARWLDVGELPQSTKYVMVLGGDENTRPFVAAALVRVGLAQKVLVSTEVDSPAVLDGILPPADERARRVLLQRGVPESEIIVLSPEANSTYDEARMLAEFLGSAADAQVAVVTSFYHTRRARWIFDRVLGDRTQQVSFVSAPSDDFQADNWWQVQEGATSIVGEYLKLAFYACRYGPLGYWAVAGAALLVLVVAYR